MKDVAAFAYFGSPSRDSRLYGTNEGGAGIDVRD